MSTVPALARSKGPRRSILDLAPLELECMNALWFLEEARVRDIRQELMATRPRAYTTIMTIMDRLAQKGIVARRKAGKAYLYRANLTAEQARAHAIEQVVDGFFEGSAESLAQHLSGAAAAGGSVRPRPRSVARPAAQPEEKASSSNGESQKRAAAAEPPATATRLDETLL